ncbi:MAG TPA: carboxypeptidase-like regulatory domain-containing protein [Methanocella sp.]|uniref:carboxypeptidase-like regulatory domain-containing protein n=1 Tax=Methanocella sp. TaxID=2052833 RepID=UPI002CE0902C|nr:carboxypeptidase-like regulatory domain-containing protein [Methanocella sp.]HTY90016.1 carboxypeptidase-like regulatory domain-containing protein [Methanocella sp.]
MSRAYLVLPALAVLLAICTAPATASTCTVHGSVTDAAGNPVQGADVTLFNGDRTEITSVKTDASGNFVFANVDVGTNLCTVRVFYNDLRQTYTNAAYFDVWYQASGDVSVPIKDARLNMYHKASSTASSSGSPFATPAPTFLISILTLLTAAIIVKKH